MRMHSAARTWRGTSAGTTSSRWKAVEEGAGADRDSSVTFAAPALGAAWATNPEAKCPRRGACARRSAEAICPTKWALRHGTTT